jgi:hypothetical protein
MLDVVIVLLLPAACGVGIFHVCPLVFLHA